MAQTIQKISVKIDRENSQIRRDLETKDDFEEKSDSEKLNSIMATYTQTWQRVLQEECVAHLVRTYPSVRLCDVIPSQDGFMVLKSQMVGTDLNDPFTSFSKILKSKFDLNIQWVQKEFDDIMPVDIYCDDLEKGERHIAALIAPVFKDVMKFHQNGKDSCWYYLNSKNIWMSSNTPNEYLITKTIQDFIEVEIQRLWLCFKS